MEEVGTAATADGKRPYRALRDHLPNGRLAFVLEPGATGRWAAPWVLAKVRVALSAWEAPCSAVALSVSPGKATPHVAERDGVNTISFHEEEWCENGLRSKGSECWPDTLPALSKVYLRDEERGGREGRTIDEVDIHINALHFRWTDDGRGRHGERVVELSRVLLHEVGHGLGFEEPCVEIGAFLANLRERPRCSDIRERPPSGMGPWEDGASGPLRIAPEESAIVCRRYPAGAR